MEASYDALGPWRPVEKIKSTIEELERIEQEDLPRQVVSDPSSAMNKDWQEAIENHNLLAIALVSVKATLERQESCGSCEAACPVHAVSPAKYVGPTVMMAHMFRCFNEFDASNRLAQVMADGLYRCTTCGRCDEVCQLDIPHVEMYQLVRQRAEAAGLKPSYAK